MNETSRAATADQGRLSKLVPIGWLIWMLVTCPVTTCAAQSVDWQTGDEFHRQLARTVAFQWQDTPLRDGLRQLAAAQRLAIFLDRNIDPNQELSITIQQQPLLAALKTIAGQVGGEVGFVGPVVYIGPAFVSQRVATLAELQNQRLAQRLPQRHRELLDPQPLAWPFLAEPRQLVAQCLQRAHLTAENLDAIPHDIWPDYELPELTWAEQMTLLLAGFRLSFVVDPQQQVRFLPFPSIVVLRREYPIGRQGASLAERVREQFPQAFVEQTDQHLIVRSTLEDHWQLTRWIEGPAQRSPTRPPVNSRQPAKRYTLTVKNQPLQAVLEAVARQTQRHLVIADDVELSPTARTSFTVKEADLAELLAAIVESSELQAELQDEAIIIRRANP